MTMSIWHEAEFIRKADDVLINMLKHHHLMMRSVLVYYKSHE